MHKRIGEVATLLNVSVDTLRYYEKIGLLGEVTRSTNGIRYYNNELIARIRFIRHAQRMGFSLDSIRQLLDFRNQPANVKPQIRKVMKQKLNELEQKIYALSQLHDELQTLLTTCELSLEPDCPILKEFEK